MNLKALAGRGQPAREKLVEVLRAMQEDRCSFFEGAKIVCALRSEIAGVSRADPDFNAFEAILSETDHLPHQAQRQYWNPDALEKLNPEFELTEKWARSFAPDACARLLVRFEGENKGVDASWDSKPS